MTFYQAEINRIRRSYYANDNQLQTVITVRNFIDNHFSEEVNLAVLSRVHFTSKFHLIRLFKRYYGLTPKHYLTIRRLEEAKTCLTKGMAVADTCYWVGFATPCSFSTLFRQKIGCSPVAFQKEQLSQRSSIPNERTCEHESKVGSDESEND